MRFILEDENMFLKSFVQKKLPRLNTKTADLYIQAVRGESNPANRTLRTLKQFEKLAANKKI